MTLISVEDYINFPNVPSDFTYVYGNDLQEFGELYLPDSDALHPVIILVHGGCYREEYNLKPMSTVARALTKEGFAVWNIEYRRAGNGGDYPQMFLDVAHAADYLRKFDVRHNLNLDQVITVGHSAGGHLALWLGARHKIPKTSDLYIIDPLPIQGVVSLAGITDLEHAIRNDICEGALSVVIGGEPDTVSSHYQVASPRALLPLEVPQTHLVGEHDTGIMANVKPYIEAAQNSGDQVQLITLPEADHFEVVTTSSEAWQTVKSAIISMRNHLFK